MNYIAHIHLAHVSQSSLLGNFLGDFVKGSNLSHLAPHLGHGVKLHRSVDSFTDRHPEIVSLRRAFPKSLRRMSGIVIDVYFDHLLCKHWDNFNQLSLNQLLHHFYTELETTPIELAGRYNKVKQGLLAHRWLNSYIYQETCLNAFISIEKRLNQKIVFAQISNDFISENEAELERAFLSFYPRLMAQVAAQGLATTAPQTPF